MKKKVVSVLAVVLMLSAGSFGYSVLANVEEVESEKEIINTSERVDQSLINTSERVDQSLIEISERDSIEDAREKGYVNQIDFKGQSNLLKDDEYQATNININKSFYLKTTAFTTIGEENNTFAKTIFIGNNRPGTNPIDIEVRNSKTQPLAVERNIESGKGIYVKIPAFSGTYTIKANASETDGYYEVIVFEN